MLSFKELSEKKTKVTLNPKLKDVMEKKCDKCGEESCECDAKKKKCPECNGKGCKHCGGTGYHGEGEGEMSEAKKDPTYLETDFKKRQKNNEKARKEMEKIPGQKNPHFEAKVYDPMEDDTFDHDEAERTRGQSGKNKSITVKKKTKKEEFAYVSQEEVSEESTEEVAETETSILTFRQFNEDRAADAKASLEKVKARQKVLDAHEKKTGKKLDISKTPEHKAHKQNFPGAKRQEKKVKGAKETPAEKHNRQVQTYTDRLKKYGKTKKQAAYDKAMSKQTSRFD
jgi:hypothetical protein